MSVDTVEVNVEDVKATAEFTPLSEAERVAALKLLPLELAEVAEPLLIERHYGSVTLTKSLRLAINAVERAEKHRQAAVNLLTHERASVDPVSSVRNKNRKFLAMQDEETLKRYCQKYKVSYQSFMASNDKAGLIDAIIDEMIIT